MTVEGAMGARMVLVIAALLLAGATGAPGTVSTLPVERLHDPVVLSTGSLASLADRDPDHYRLYAVRDGAVVAVPFQVDARDRRTLKRLHPRHRITIRGSVLRCDDIIGRLEGVRVGEGEP